VIRPIDEVVAEVRELERRYGLRKVFFIDNGFNVPLDHAKALCQTLIASDIRLHWNTCLAPFGCDDELIGLMKQAGCTLVIMGGMRGGIHGGAGLGDRVAPMRETCRMCEAQDLHYTLAVTFGEPGETRATVEEKLDFLRGIKPAVAILRIGVSVLPGMAVAELARQEGLIADEADLVKPTFYVDAAVRDWIVDYLQEAKAGHPRWQVV
jgi:hypothetical protein